MAHETFGIGEVTKLILAAKCVLFQDRVRRLIHAQSKPSRAKLGQ